MNTHRAQREAIRQYLLGQLPEAEQPEFEERLLAEDLFYQELLIEEDELVDEYLAGSLNLLEREQFESYFLRTPERVRKIRFGKALRRYVANSAPEPRDASVEPEVRQRTGELREAPHRSVFSFLPDFRHRLAYSFAAIVCLTVVVVAWLATRHGQSSQPSGSVFAVTLIPGGTRDASDGMTRFAVPSGTGTLRLKLELARNDYRIYQAAISDANDKLILRANDLYAQSEGGRASIIVEVKAGLIPPNDYQVKLSGLTSGGQSEGVARYSFRVVK